MNLVCINYFYYSGSSLKWNWTMQENKTNVIFKDCLCSVKDYMGLIVSQLGIYLKYNLLKMKKTNDEHVTGY